MTLKELIEALEKASEGSRVLDIRIWLALFDKQILVDGGGYAPRTRPLQYKSAREIWTDDWPYWDVPSQVESVGMEIDAPAYTASIDAALTLVPDGQYWRVERIHTPINEGFAMVWKFMNGGVEVYARTPILALVIASLKARDTQV